MNQPLSTQEITAEASASVQQDDDIHGRVRDLALRALRTRSLEAGEIRAVVRAVAEGVSLGAGQRAGEVKQAVGDALSGLDEAVAKVAQATNLAMKELLAQGKDFTEQDLKPALEELKITEQALVEILKDVAEHAGSTIAQEFKEAVEHIRRSGTGTGASVSAILSELGGRLSATLQSGKSAGQEAARTVSGRLAGVASGILGGMADALREKSEQARKK